jgi:F-type H+-transporting ATPase subunit delta
MRITKQARREARGLFRACQVQGLLDEGKARRAVAVVIGRRPRGYLALLHCFLRLVRIDADRRTALVESAQALAPDLQADIQANLNRIYGAGLSTGFTMNSALIGGVRVRVGSDVYDGSVQRRLDDLRDSF